MSNENENDRTQPLRTPPEQSPPPPYTFTPPPDRSPPPFEQSETDAHLASGPGRPIPRSNPGRARRGEGPQQEEVFPVNIPKNRRSHPKQKPIDDNDLTTWFHD